VRGVQEDGVEPELYRFLDLELGGVLRALVVDRRFASPFGSGLVVGEDVLDAPDRDGGRVDEPLRLSRERSRGDVARPFDVVLRLLRVVLRPEADIAGDVEDGVGPFRDRGLERGAIVEAPLGELDASHAEARDVGGRAVEGDDVPVVGEERVDDVQAEEAGSAGDEGGA